MNDHAAAAQDRALLNAVQEHDTFYVRKAEPGDGACCFCLEPLVVGEYIDRLFLCHLACYDENVSYDGGRYHGTI